LRQKRKFLICILALGAALVMGIGIFTCKDEVLERIYLSRLQSKSQFVLADAARRLGKMKSVKALPRLIELLRKYPHSYMGGNPYEQALIDVGRPAALPVGELLKENNGTLEYIAREILRGIGPPAVDVFILRAKDGNEAERRHAIYVLGEIGPGAQRALPLILDAMTDPDEETRVSATRALGSLKIGTEEVARALARACIDESIKVRNHATLSLSGIGKEAALAVPFLRELLKTGSEVEKLTALGALAAVGSLAGDAAPEVQEALEDPSGLVRETAARVLKRIQVK